MAEEETREEKPVTKAKKAKLEAPPPEPKAEAKRPTPHEVREAHKADLVRWSEELGLSTEGKVDDLRKRLLQHLEVKEKPKRAEEEKPEAPPEKKPAEKKPAKLRRAAKEEKEEEEAEEEAKVHEARLKPELDSRMRALLEVRRRKSAERPPFRRQEWFRYARFSKDPDSWRKPQGGQSKLRRHFGYRWNLPSVGYRGPKEVRGLHPSGFQEVLVHNPKQLEGLDPARQAVRIAHAVGARKRELIEKACDERKLRVLNRMVLE